MLSCAWERTLGKTGVRKAKSDDIVEKVATTLVLEGESGSVTG